MSSQFHKNLQRWRALTHFVLGQLRLADIQDSAELCLRKVEAANLPNTTSDSVGLHLFQELSTLDLRHREGPFRSPCIRSNKRFSSPQGEALFDERRGT